MQQHTNKFIALVFVLLILGPSDCAFRSHITKKIQPKNEIRDLEVDSIDGDDSDTAEKGGGGGKMDNRAMIGALLGFPIGYVTGESTLASSGDDNPSAGAFAFGLAGAASGYLTASKWGDSEKSAYQQLMKEGKDGDAEFIANKKLYDTEKAKAKDNTDANAKAEAEKKANELAKKLNAKVRSAGKGKDGGKGGVNSDELKSGAMAGLVAGAIGSTFSGSSGGSGGGGGGTQTQNANTQTQAAEGPSAMSSKMPILHSIIAGAVAAVAVSGFKDTVQQMTDKYNDASKEHAKKKEEDAKKAKDPTNPTSVN